MTGAFPALPPLPLAQGTHDRCAAARAAGAALEAAWAHPGARVLRVHSGATLLTADGSAPVVLTPDQIAAPQSCWYLGRGVGGDPWFALPGEFAAGPGERAAGLREITGALPPAAVGLFVHAVGLDNWHARNRFCAACGAPSRIVGAGHVRECTGCGSEHFPRTDPAVIMLVTDDADRCLLGHNPNWPPGQFSTLAGFVEPGESLEQAVIREVAEEVGVVVDRVTYEGSQPWPLPSSLMIGFRAHAADPSLLVDVAEITEARWFTREEIVECGRRREVLMPGPISIARWLIERWFGSDLPPENIW